MVDAARHTAPFSIRPLDPTTGDASELTLKHGREYRRDPPAGRQAQGRFLFTATAELFEQFGFSRVRQVGKHAWIVSRVVQPGSATGLSSGPKAPGLPQPHGATMCWWRPRHRRECSIPGEQP